MGRGQLAPPATTRKPAFQMLPVPLARLGTVAGMLWSAALDTPERQALPPAIISQPVSADNWATGYGQTYNKNGCSGNGTPAAGLSYEEDGGTWAHLRSPGVGCRPPHTSVSG